MQILLNNRGTVLAKQHSAIGIINIFFHGCKHIYCVYHLLEGVQQVKMLLIALNKINIEILTTIKSLYNFSRAVFQVVRNQ